MPSPCSRPYLELLALFLFLTVQTLWAEELPLIGETSDGKMPTVPALTVEGIPHPTSFFGYALGERFTHYHRILDYFEALDAASERVSSIEFSSLSSLCTTRMPRPPPPPAALMITG